MNTTHYFSILKYFAAEALVCGNSLLFASAEVKKWFVYFFIILLQMAPHEFLKSLPAEVEESVHAEAEEEERKKTQVCAFLASSERSLREAASPGDLNIAWRYKDSVRKAQERGGSKAFAHAFDLSKPIQVFPQFCVIERCDKLSQTELLEPRQIDLIDIKSLQGEGSLYERLYHSIAKSMASHQRYEESLLYESLISAVDCQRMPRTRMFCAL